MKVPFGARHRRDTQTAQTLVFFLLAWGTIMLLCGLAIDSGLLYLAKARLGRAVDGAALAAVGNFNRSSNAITNRDDVALIMRNFAVANYTDLGSIGSSGGPSGGTATTTTGSNGQSQTSYIYSFNDGTTDANGQYRRFVQVTLNTGSGGNITSATCNARCPVQTYFIGYASYAINGRQNVKIGGYSGPSSLIDLKVSSSAVATRNPRLIMVVCDRSASMLAAGGGADGLPPAVVQFLDFFDTSSDYIGIVSFGSSARLEMPLTTNFLIAGTNDLIDAYNTNSNPSFGSIPGVDPEQIPDSGVYDANYNTTGVRRLKFGGQTAADEGIRLAMEQMMANSGFNDPDVVKYIVLFTDGKWNASRTLLAAPGYTNYLFGGPTTGASTNKFLANATAAGMTNGQDVGGPQGGGPWDINLANDTNLLVMPSLGQVSTNSNIQFMTNAIAIANVAQSSFSPFLPNLTNYTWQSIDTSGYEPFNNPGSGEIDGAPMAVTNTALLYSSGGNNYYGTNVDVWLTPGSVAYYYPTKTALNTQTPTAVYVSELNNPTKHINLQLPAGSVAELVVPGYLVDGIIFDGVDLGFSAPEDPSWPRYRCNNFQEAFMWPDDTAAFSEPPYTAMSVERQLMFRNYPNLLTGFYVFRPDEPLSTATEPLDDTTPATYRPLYGLGPYYPSAGFYWPFDDVGVDYDPTFALLNPLSDPDPDDDQSYSGGSRHIAYSINMSSAAAAPEWSGELFYDSISGGGPSVSSGTGSTAASQIMTSASWKTGMPAWLSGIENADIMTNEPAHNSSITPAPSVYRPVSFSGTSADLLGSIAIVTPTDPLNYTGGYVADGPQGAAGTHYYRNTMAWSGRPTHYFDVTKSKWIPVANNHVSNIQALPIGNWKVAEYAWHARALGVTIYTVGYGSLVSQDEQALLAQIANATNTTAGGGTAIAYNPSQPIGQQFYATNSSQISNDFYSVGQAINEALTGGQ
jgi:Flp pilus assembly protein TadG